MMKAIIESITFGNVELIGNEVLGLARAAKKQSDYQINVSVKVIGTSIILNKLMNLDEFKFGKQPGDEVTIEATGHRFNIIK